MAVNAVFLFLLICQDEVCLAHRMKKNLLSFSAFKAVQKLMANNQWSLQLEPSFGLLLGSTVDPKQHPCSDCISILWLDVATAELISA